MPIDKSQSGKRAAVYFTDMLFALRYAKENRRRMMKAMKETVAEFVPEVNFLRTIDIHHL